VIRIAVFIILLALMYSVSSCGIRKKLESPESLSSETAMNLWQAVVDQNIDYNWYHAKADLDFSSEDFSLGGQADIRMKKDSVIMISVRKFGLEMARVLIRKDSVFVLNRLQANYAAESIDSLKSLFNVPFSYAQMEEILVGNNIAESQQVISSKIQKEGYLLNTRGDYIQSNFLIDSQKKVQLASYRDIEDRSFEVEYSNYKNFEDLHLAGARKYFYPDKMNAEYSLEVRLEKVEIDQPKKIRFEIPSSYTEF
jgi:hypothetical protein